MFASCLILIALCTLEIVSSFRHFLRRGESSHYSTSRAWPNRFIYNQLECKNVATSTSACSTVSLQNNPRGKAGERSKGAFLVIAYKEISRRHAWHTCTLINYVTAIKIKYRTSRQACVCLIQAKPFDLHFKLHLLFFQLLFFFSLCCFVFNANREMRKLWHVESMNDGNCAKCGMHKTSNNWNCKIGNTQNLHKWKMNNASLACYANFVLLLLLQSAEWSKFQLASARYLCKILQWLIENFKNFNISTLLKFFIVLLRRYELRATRSRVESS